MRKLKYALLGVINSRDISGYDLMKEFEITLNEFWHANHSQIYPELKRLTDENLITYRIETIGNSLEKKIYSITDEGRKQFLDWLCSETKFEQTPKNIFRLKVFFSDNLDPDQRLQLLSIQLERHLDRKKHLEGNLSKFETIPSKNEVGFGDYLILLGAIKREESTCEWLETCIELCTMS